MIFVTTTVVNVWAQQKPHYTMYMANPYLINPAMAGSEDFVDIKMGFREQWSGIKDNPRTYYLSGHTAIGKSHSIYHHYSENKNWAGVGGMVLRDETGVISTTSALVTGTYDFGVTKGIGYGYGKHHDGIRAIAGLSVGLQAYQVDVSKFEQITIDEIVANDPALMAVGSNNKFLPDGNFGLWLYQDHLFYLGFSSMQLFGNKLDFTEANKGKLNRHYFLTGGYHMQIGTELWFFPSFVVKKVGAAPYSVDINGSLEYKDGLLWGGVSYRHADAINLLLGTVIAHQYEVAYSFDITTSGLRKGAIDGKTFYGTHEIMIGYRILPRATLANAVDHQGRNMMNKHKNRHH